MEDLRQEIRSLIRRLETPSLTSGNVEAMTLDRLQVLCAAAERAQQPGDLASLFRELRQFWLDSIDWCSQLSRDIERLLILHDELNTDG